MKPNSDSIFVTGIGLVDAVPRDPERIYNHFFRGGTSPEFLDRAAEMTVQANIREDTLHIIAAITNKGAGHKLPTGVSFRNMLLVVTAANGTDTLALISGERIPHFGGTGNLAEGNYANHPGKDFALVTRNASTGEWPVPNWQATEIFYDSRIPAEQTDTSEYKFLIPGGNEFDISVQLLYRAVYKPWADVKGWDMREYLAADTAFTLLLTAISDDGTTPPKRFILHQNFPNPFNGTTTIRYELPEASFVNVAIYNIRGQTVAILTNTRQLAGQHQIRWDGKNREGRSVPSGVYVYRIKAGKYLKTLKMVLVE